ncbi:barstar family protein [Janthinobacterium sp. 1_2014MBL_MicDiv]|uniref:barstar family protein n=1 Tax=Janthinobacterium sp. 1_2014MBL_MicDiv TaxID=1644131 RepID=UPI0008F48ABC|nr:barstar family protein [Janthinobacterium sp. 1_2014MBL_MicDiv]APA69032.1 ribonuclease inhibitor [Janthinobacterium sp. 1_2014MBL_MicDiv]
MSRPAHVRIDLSEIHSPRQLHAALAAALGFPAIYGMNWDAFWDAVTGLVDMPQQLDFAGWQALEARLPREAAVLRRSLARLAAEFPALAAHVRYA